jgi:hypothetical protein
MSAAEVNVEIVTKDRREDTLTAVAWWLAQGTARI